MRCCPALALLGCFVAFPAVAQHGGFHGGGGGHASGAFRGNFSSGARGGPGVRSSGGAFRGTGPGSYRSPAGVYGPRSAIRTYPTRSILSGSYSRSRGGYAPPLRRYPGRSPYGYPRSSYPSYAFPGVVSFGYATPFWDFADNLGYDQPPYDTQPAYPEGDPTVAPYGPQAGDPFAAQQTAPYPTQPGQAYAASPSDGSQPLVYAPYAYGYPSQPQVTVITLPPPQREEDAVTIFYRDGRPPEQIRNYALTRSALLITGDRLREIPLEVIDLPLTERVNRAAGVDFRLPQAN